MVTSTNHAIAGPYLRCTGPDLCHAGPLAVWAFLQHLSPKYRGRPKKVLRFERKAPSWYCAMLWSIQPWLMHYVHKKAIQGSEIATFGTKTLHFFRVIRFNWLAKYELRETWGPWSSILLLVTVANDKG